MSYVTFNSPFGFLIREFLDIGSSRMEDISFSVTCSSISRKQNIFFVGSSMKLKTSSQKPDFLIVQIVSSRNAPKYWENNTVIIPLFNLVQPVSKTYQLVCPT